MNFDFYLAEEKVKPHQSIALHILIAIALLAFGIISTVFYEYTFLNKRPLLELKWLAMFLSAFGFGILIISLFFRKWLWDTKHNLIFRCIELIAALIFAIYFYYYRQWLPSGIFGGLAITVLLAMFWEHSSNAGLSIHIDEKNIKLPATSRRKTLEWFEVDRVILRHGVLTIDALDNSLFQWDIGKTNIDSEIFEAFCHAQIEANKEKRVKDW